MFYPDVGLAQGLLVITVVIVLHRAMAFVFARYRHVESAVEGEPLLVVERGAIREEVLGSGTITRRELLTLLRLSGVRDLGEVELGYLEPQGRLSVFKYDRPTPRETTLPPKDIALRNI